MFQLIGFLSLQIHTLSKDFLCHSKHEPPTESVFSQSNVLIFLLVVTKAGSHCYKVLINAPEKDEEEQKEMTQVAAVVSELDGIFLH